MKSNRKIGNPTYFASHSASYQGTVIFALIVTVLVSLFDANTIAKMYGSSTWIAFAAATAFVFLIERAHRSATIAGVRSMLSGTATTIGGAVSIIVMCIAFALVVIMQLTIRHSAIDIIVPKPNHIAFSDTAIAKSTDAVTATIAALTAQQKRLESSAMAAAKSAPKTTANKVANWSDRESAGRMIAQSKAKAESAASKEILKHNAELTKTLNDLAIMQGRKDTLTAIGKARVDAINAKEYEKYQAAKSEVSMYVTAISWLIVALLTCMYIWTADFYHRSEITYEHVPSVLDHFPSGIASVVSAVGAFTKAAMLRLAKAIDGNSFVTGTKVTKAVTLDENEQTRVEYIGGRAQEGTEQRETYVDIPSSIKNKVRNLYNSQNPNIQSRGSSKSIDKAREKYNNYKAELEAKGFIVEGAKVTVK